MGYQANLLQSLGWAVLNSLWQMALLWVVYKLILAFAKQARPAAKSLLASFLLFTGFAWFIFTFLHTYLGNNISGNDLSSVLLNENAGNTVSAWLQRTLPLASVVYLVLLIIPALRFIRNYRYVQVIRSYGLSKLPADWRLFVNRTAARMGIKKPVLAWVSDLVSSPVTIGFWKPVILVPMAAINHLTTEQLEAVLLHELSHIRRYDYLVNLLINFIQTILYFNPFVKAFVKIVEREREKSCDEMVLQFQYDSYEYASALLTLEKTSRLQRPLALGAAGKKNDLLHRVETILGVQRKPVISFNKIAGLFAGLLCIIGLNTLLIITRPVGEKGYDALAELSSPADIFNSGMGDEKEIESDQPLQRVAEALHNTIVTGDMEDKKDPEQEAGYPATVINPEFIQASLDLAKQQVKLLGKKEELQIQHAIESSKKVLEEAQWKNVEKEIADVFSRNEKEKLKISYEKALNNLDWKSWENKLRNAFDKVDWEKVNEQLNNAVSMVRIDSLQRVYADALNRIDVARAEMQENNISGIPDSDITLKELEKKRADLQKLNSYLKGIRTKKIVRL